MNQKPVEEVSIIVSTLLAHERSVCYAIETEAMDRREGLMLPFVRIWVLGSVYLIESMHSK